MDEINRERIFGKHTLHRVNPQTGEDEYYYLDPRGARTFAEMKEIPVPSENSPNPFADEIQNYLYEHDDYNYKQLYGSTPPPSMQIPPAAQQSENNTANATLGQPSSYFQNNTNSLTNNLTPTPWSNPAEQISSVPWQNNQTITPWAGGYDLSAPTQSNDIQSIDYSRYGEGFSKEFIDKMLNDTEFQNILNEYIIPNEGGYNNDPADAGGETNMGIAQNAHTDEDIKNMTRERANAIYYRDYYNWNGLNKLPYPIRGFVVDYGLPTRPQLAVETVHKVLDIPPPSNIIGPTTLGKFENYTEEDYNNFLDKYREEMKKHFREVAQKNPQKRKFLNGWLNRADGAHLAR